MDLTTDDTIVAVATPRQGAARGIIRLSGLQTLACLEPCFRASGSGRLEELRRPRVVEGELTAGAPLAAVPGHLYVWPTSASYTRQPAAEFHTLGAPVLLDALVQQLCRCGARLAGPGEFTMRAFLAGRLDLPQAEAVLGVIDAADQHQLATALTQLAGGLSQPLQQLRDQLLDLLADLEAGLDFADEGIEFVEGQELVRQLKEARGQTSALIRQIQHRGLGLDRPKVVLIGAPNAGKSTLWNKLTGSYRAIVSEVCGTTRDFLSATVQLDGLTVELIDTAGSISQSEPGSPEYLAQGAARRAAESADLKILCLDATRLESVKMDYERDVAHQLVVITKHDLAPRIVLPGGTIAMSCVTGEGLAALQRAIGGRLARRGDTESSVVGATAVRCQESLRLAADGLAEAARLAHQGGQEELLAGTLRAALDELGRVAGQVYTEDLLDRIFGRFCIGK